MHSLRQYNKTQTLLDNKIGQQYEYSLWTTLKAGV